MRVVDIDPAKTKSCSGAHRHITTPKPLCTRRGRGCYSAYFSTHGVPYMEVRGFAYGYQVRRNRDWRTQGKVLDATATEKTLVTRTWGNFL